jgi:hypothetical protein
MFLCSPTLKEICSTTKFGQGLLKVIYNQLSVVPLYQLLVRIGLTKISICRPTCLLY